MNGMSITRGDVKEYRRELQLINHLTVAEAWAIGNDYYTRLWGEMTRGPFFATTHGAACVRVDDYIRAQRGKAGSIGLPLVEYKKI